MQPPAAESTTIQNEEDSIYISLFAVAARDSRGWFGGLPL